MPKMPKGIKRKKSAPKDQRAEKVMNKINESKTNNLKMIT